MEDRNIAARDSGQKIGIGFKGRAGDVDIRGIAHIGARFRGGTGSRPTREGSSRHGGRMFRKLILGLVVGSALTANTGCLLNQYSSHPDERMQQLLYQSEDLRQIKNEWRRFWFNDQPSHMTPERIHGGII